MALGKSLILFILIIALIVLAINVNLLISQKTKPSASIYKNDPLAPFKNPSTWKWLLLLGLILLITGLILLYLRISSV